jgi:hypothetical protein
MRVLLEAHEQIAAGPPVPADVRELCGQVTALSALADRDGNYDLAMCLATLRDALSRLAAEKERLERDNEAMHGCLRDVGEFLSD